MMCCAHTTSHRPRAKLQCGFSLLELMVVVAIIGILITIAIPAYTESVLRGRRAEGQTAILALLQQQERFMTQNNRYASYAAGATTGDAAAFKNFSGDAPNAMGYQLGAQQCDTPDDNLQQCVRIIAVPRFTDPICGTLRMTSLGVKDNIVDTTVETNARCWK